MNEGLLIRVYNGCNKEPETARRLREKENYIYQSGCGGRVWFGPGIAPPGPRRPAALSPARSGG